ncbi:MAG: autotransporter assembly complex protein TamA, partial [Hyphomicrobiaceae bacterium]
GLSHQFRETLTGSIALAGTYAEETDAAGKRTDVALSVPMAITEDKRDNKLDPTAGWRALVSLEPTYEFNRGDAYLTARGQISAYRALDASGRFVIAGRVGAAGILGADLEDLRPSQRLYAGGGGSVRGYAYKSLAPTLENGAMGGSSLIEASLEMRMRITPTIGIVPFVDAASVGGGDWPDTSEVKVGAGLGLRYYTALGPLRLDVATPLSGRDGQDSVSFYVGLGQAF